MLAPDIVLQLSQARSLNDAAQVWVDHPQELADYFFVISSPGPTNFRWAASIDLEGGGFLRSLFAHNQLHFVSHSILSGMVNEGEIQVPVDYSIGFDINAAQYLRRVVEGKRNDTILRFKQSLQALAKPRFNWEVFPYLQERAEAVIEGRDLDDIWAVIHASEQFAACDLSHFTETGELVCLASEDEVVAKTSALLSNWHRFLIDGEMEKIRQSHLMLYVLLLKIALLYRAKPSPRDAGRNTAEFIHFMCGSVGVTLPWMMWAAAKLFEEGGENEPLRKLNEKAGLLVENCRNIAWDFMHYFYRRQQAHFMGHEGSFLLPYTLTFDRGLAALFSGFGQRSCLLHGDDAMGQFFAENDPHKDILNKYNGCSALVAAFDQHFTLAAHLERKRRIATNPRVNRLPLYQELERQCQNL